MAAAAHAGLPARSTTLEAAARIPPVSRAEARRLAEAELGRLLALVEALGAEDWTQPTACTLWDVRQIVAHQAGAYASFASWREFWRQFGARPRPGQLREDLISSIQVADRAARTPAELIAELRAAGRRTIANRQRVPWPLRRARIPHPLVGHFDLGYLFDIIYTRDTWMHRLDICRATGRSMALTGEHDGRIVALVMRDLAHTVAPKLGGQAVAVELAGPAGGAWQIGPGTPLSTIRMDTLDFNVLASGRFSFEAGRARAVVEGDVALAEDALRACQALY